MITHITANPASLFVICNAIHKSVMQKQPRPVYANALCPYALYPISVDTPAVRHDVPKRSAAPPPSVENHVPNI
ncbi:MAG: hypothetical protein IKQ90_00775 [Ruminococcus sp.]|nr:hypothetical protein [Ruminococcus sp.]